MFTSLFAVIVSVVSKTILFPCINSKDDPCGIGTFFIKWISSADALVIPIPQGSSFEFMAGNKIVLETTDTITAKSDVASSLDVALTIMEIT